MENITQVLGMLHEAYMLYFFRSLVNTIVIATFQELEKAMENITQVLRMLYEANLSNNYRSFVFRSLANTNCNSNMSRVGKGDGEYHPGTGNVV